MFYSIVIPVYNRPDEVDELLASLCEQSVKSFEVVIVEDGSQHRCEEVVSKYASELEVSYHYKENSGPAGARNYGVERSRGDYLIFMDSDCIAPSMYIEEIERGLEGGDVDIFGGPDRAHSSFSTIQKAINYSMTSLFTTGGIRGGKRRMDKFYPRSFNLGVRRDVFDVVGGFSDMRFGEDIDFSLKVFGSGYTSTLLPEAWVYHKRRTNIRAFFKQVFNSGVARVSLYKKHPESLKMVYLLPSMFTLGLVGLLIASCFYPLLLLLVALYVVMVAVDSTIRNRSLIVGIYSVATSFVQLLGYGCGFIVGWWKLCILKQEKFSAFGKTFYK